MPAKLKYGVIGAPGGARKNAGRKPDEFKRWASKLVHSPKNRLRLEKILMDAPDAETLVTSEGVEVPVRARADTYLRAYELMCHYAEGKPVARVEAGVDEKTVDLLSIIASAEKSRGL